MAEDPRLLLHFKTLAKFKEKLADGTVSPDRHFVIIKDEKLIWIRGVYYADNSKLENIISLYNNWELSQTSSGVEITLKGKLWNDTTRKWDNISKALTIDTATLSIAGLMSTSDKTKIDRITGTNYSISTPSATSTTRNIKITGIDPSNGNAVSSNVDLPEATTTKAGVLSALDKKKLEAIEYSDASDNNTAGIKKITLSAGTTDTASIQTETSNDKTTVAVVLNDNFGTSTGNYDDFVIKGSNGSVTADDNIRLQLSDTLKVRSKNNELERVLTSVDLSDGSVTKVGTASVGSGTKPIYLNGGTPTASSSTVGSAIRPVYMNAGTITLGTYSFGNASGNAAINNGTVNTNLNADKLDGVHLTNVNYCPDSAISGSQDTITTAQFVLKLKDAGAFNYRHWTTKGSWYYAGHSIITDTGLGNILLAGAVIELWSESESVYTIKVTTSPASTSDGVTNAVFVYRNHGDDYNPNWKRIANTTDNVASATKLQTSRSISLTGPITGSASFDGTANASITTTITNDSVSNSKLANMPANTIKGNNRNAGDPIDLTTSLVRSMLSISNVNNTSDADKPISTATQTALNGINSSISSIQSKLNSVLSGAEANVLPDWNITDTTSDAYIKNKPTLATVATSGRYSDLSGTPGNATTSSSGLMSSSDKQKLDGLSTSGDYVLPTASSTVLGGVKIGTGLNIANGVLSSIAIMGSVVYGQENSVSNSGIYIVTASNGAIVGLLLNIKNVVLYRVSVVNKVDVLTDNSIFYLLRFYSGGTWSEWTDVNSSSGGSYILPTASSTTLGGVKIGYTQSGKNYPVKLDSNNRMYVNVPWTSGGGGYSGYNYNQIAIPICTANSTVNDTYGACDRFSGNLYIGTYNTGSTAPYNYTKTIISLNEYKESYFNYMPCLLVKWKGNPYVPLESDSLNLDYVLFPSSIVNKVPYIEYNFVWLNPKDNKMCMRTIVINRTDGEFIVTKEKQIAMTVI